MPRPGKEQGYLWRGISEKIEARARHDVVVVYPWRVDPVSRSERPTATTIGRQGARVSLRGFVGGADTQNSPGRLAVRRLWAKC